MGERDDPRVDWSQGDWLAETQRLEAALKRCEERGELRLAQLDKAAQHAVEIEAKCERLEAGIRNALEQRLTACAGDDILRAALSTPKTEKPNEAEKGATNTPYRLVVSPKTEGER